VLQVPRIELLHTGMPKGALEGHKPSCHHHYAGSSVTAASGAWGDGIRVGPMHVFSCARTNLNSTVNGSEPVCKAHHDKSPITCRVARSAVTGVTHNMNRVEHPHQYIRAFFASVDFFSWLCTKSKERWGGGNGVRNTKAGQQTPNRAKNNAAVAAYKASGSPTFVPNQTELLAAYIEQKRAEQAVTNTRPEQEPIDEDQSPVLAESTLAPAPTTPLPATPLPATPLPTAPTTPPAPRRTGLDVGIVVAIVVPCVVLLIIGGLWFVSYKASKQSSKKRRRFS
jgi:hypothetical protein